MYPDGGAFVTISLENPKYMMDYQSIQSLGEHTQRRTKRKLLKRLWKRMRRWVGEIISLYCGGGKTTIAINIISKIKRKKL